MILSLPAMQLIRDYYGGGKLELVGNRAILNLIAKDLGARKVYSIDQGRFSFLFEEAGEMPAESKEYYDGLDRIFIFTRNPHAAFIQNLENNLSERLRMISCLPAAPGIHVTCSQLEALKDMGSSSRYLPVRLVVDEWRGSPGVFGDSDLEKYDFKRVIGIHPGSGSAKKCWPSASFVDLMHALALENDTAFIFFLGPAEESWAHSCLGDTRGLRILPVLKRPTEEAAQFVKLCRVYVGNDSGFSHLAAALGVPTIAIFGPTDPGLWRPMGKNVMVLEPDVNCAPCGRIGYQNCQDRSCLESIKMKTVVEAVERLIN